MVFTMDFIKSRPLNNLTSTVTQDIDRTKVINYFAYGSNMNTDRMRERGVFFYSRQPLMLVGYSLIFNKKVSTPNAGAANIVPDKNGVVEGVLYRVSLKGIFNLDKYEHYPNEYERVIMRVPYDDKNHIVIKTYIARPDITAKDLKPTKLYLEHLLAAEDLLSENYFNQLKIIDTLD